MNQRTQKKYPNSKKIPSTIKYPNTEKQNRDITMSSNKSLTHMVGWFYQKRFIEIEFSAVKGYHSPCV